MRCGGGAAPPGRGGGAGGGPFRPGGGGGGGGWGGGPSPRGRRDATDVELYARVGRAGWGGCGGSSRVAMRAEVVERSGAVDLDRDRALVLRYQAGDQTAFDELYRRYYPSLH